MAGVEYTQGSRSRDNVKWIVENLQAAGFSKIDRTFLGTQLYRTKTIPDVG